MKYSFIILLVFMCVQFSQAQLKDAEQDCDLIDISVNKKNSPKISTLESFQKEILKKYSKKRPPTLDIPVIFHVFHYEEDNQPENYTTNPSEDDLLASLDYLNNAMQDAISSTGSMIRFCRAIYDPQNQVLDEPGIIRVPLNDDQITSGIFYGFPFEGVNYPTLINHIMPQEIWDPHKYLNIWVVPGYMKYYTDPEISFKRPNGSAFFPRYPSLEGVDIGEYTIQLDKRSSAVNDGIILSTNNAYKGMHFGGLKLDGDYSILAHEAGHWLGGIHVQGNKNDDIGQNYCLVDDYCEDTELCVTITYCNPPPTCEVFPPIYNLLNNASNCRNEFTPCQFQRFHTALTNDFMRYSITQNSHLCNEATWNTAVAEPSFDVLCIGDEFHWSDYIDVFVPTGTMVQYSWSIDNGQSWTPFQTNPTLIAGSNVSYLVQVATINIDGTLTVLSTIDFDMWVILDCNWPPNDGPLPYPDDKYDTFRVFPNPAMNQLKVASNETIESIEVFDLLFREQSIITRDFDHIDISKYSDGILFVKVKFENGIIQTSKVIKAAN